MVKKKIRKMEIPQISIEILTFNLNQLWVILVTHHYYKSIWESSPPDKRATCSRRHAMMVFVTLGSQDGMCLRMELFST